MDPAVALVQAYLRVNGFFTVTEYPVIRKTRQGSRTLTDLDILGLRFPKGGRWIQQASGGWETFSTDPLLPESDENFIMILGEVKEGKANFNRNAFHPDVLEAVLRRFGCCHGSERANVLAISRKGCLTTTLSHGAACAIHTMLFAGSDEPKKRGTHCVPLRHVAEFLAATVRDNPDLFVASQPKDAVLDLVALFVKTGTRFPVPRDGSPDLAVASRPQTTANPANSRRTK